MELSLRIFSNSISSWCRSDKKLARLCGDIYFWRRWLEAHPHQIPDLLYSLVEEDDLRLIKLLLTNLDSHKKYFSFITFIRALDLDKIELARFIYRLNPLINKISLKEWTIATNIHDIIDKIYNVFIWSLSDKYKNWRPNADIFIKKGDSSLEFNINEENNYKLTNTKIGRHDIAEILLDPYSISLTIYYDFEGIGYSAPWKHANEYYDDMGLYIPEKLSNISERYPVGDFIFLELYDGYGINFSVKKQVKK